MCESWQVYIPCVTNGFNQGRLEGENSCDYMEITKILDYVF